MERLLNMLKERTRKEVQHFIERFPELYCEVKTDAGDGLRKVFTLYGVTQHGEIEAIEVCVFDDQSEYIISPFLFEDDIKYISRNRSSHSFAISKGEKMTIESKTMLRMLNMFLIYLKTDNRRDKAFLKSEIVLFKQELAKDETLPNDVIDFLEEFLQ